ncbi:MAG: hypothetical protein J6Y62_03230 [Clostridia bacterium]|nr:hypothetical protein [Clostridia bacterium]
MIKSIPDSKVAIFHKLVAFLNKKQTQYGRPLTTVKEVGSHVEQVKFRTHYKGDAFKNDTFTTGDVLFIDFEVENLEIVKNNESYEYVGTRTVKGGAPIVYCADEQYFPEVSKDVNVCDHCHTNRFRNVVHVFKRPDGSVFRVGSACGKDYFGINANAVLNIYVKTFMLMKDADDDGLFDCSEMVYGWDAVYEAAREETHGFADWNKGDLDYKVVLARESHREELEKIREYWEGQSESNSFAFNCASVMSGCCVKSYQIKLAFAAVHFGAVKIRQAEEREARRKAFLAGLATDIPVYKVGDKVEFEGTVVKNQPVETMYGVSRLIIVNARGILYKTFTTTCGMSRLEVGSEIKAKATFKCENDFNGATYLQIIRMKVLTVKAPETEETEEAEEAMA